MNMLSRSASPAQKYNRFATLSIIWSVVAGLAFAILPWAMDNPNINGANVTISLFQNGANGLSGGAFNLIKSNQTLIYVLYVLVLLIPIALVVSFITGLITRIRPPASGLARIHTIAGIIGLLGTFVLFIPFVFNDPKDVQGFATALGLIVVSSIVPRVRKNLNNLFTDHPTFASMGLLAIAYVTLLLASGTAVIQLIFNQRGIWLMLASFVIVVISGYRMQRFARQSRKH